MTSTHSEMNPVKMMKMVRQFKCFIKQVAVLADSKHKVFPNHFNEPKIRVFDKHVV